MGDASPQPVSQGGSSGALSAGFSGTFRCRFPRRSGQERKEERRKKERKKQTKKERKKKEERRKKKKEERLQPQQRTVAYSAARRSERGFLAFSGSFLLAYQFKDESAWQRHSNKRFFDEKGEEKKS